MRKLLFTVALEIKGCEAFSYTNISLNHMGYLMPFLELGIPI
jgi:hypothetical protein